MNTPLCVWNGQLVAPEQAKVPLDDAGFMLGVTVAEQLRTFGGKLFRWEDHVQRLLHSLEIVQVELPLSVDEFTRLAEELVAHNHGLLSEGDDLNLTLFVTPGSYGGLASGTATPLCAMHTKPLPFSQWGSLYRKGETLVTTDVEQVSKYCWPPELKCRSRMHYYLADLAARQAVPGSRAVMRDQEGYLTEATTANLLVYYAGEGLLVPPARKVLPGISLAMVEELAADLDLTFSETELRANDLADADEVLLVSTSPCILPVTQFNQRPVQKGKPGPIFKQLIEAWSDRVGIDIIAQAEQFAQR